MIRELTLRSITDRQDRGCVGVDAAVFYPRQRTRGAIDYAKRFCDRCPITNDCRAYASTHDLEGIWGAPPRPNGGPRHMTNSDGHPSRRS